MNVKQRIRSIIDARPDLTMRGVSLASGMSDSALHKFLTNPDQSMTIDNLEKVAQAMGVPLTQLLTDEPPMPSAEIINIFERIPIEHRPLALRALRSFEGRA